jgi:hypothetical protein
MTGPLRLPLYERRRQREYGSVGESGAALGLSGVIMSPDITSSALASTARARPAPTVPRKLAKLYSLEYVASRRSPRTQPPLAGPLKLYNNTSDPNLRAYLDAFIRTQVRNAPRLAR